MPHHHTLLPFFPSPYAYFYDYDRSGDSAVSSIFKLILCKFCSLNLAIRIWRRIISDFLRWPDQKMLFCAIMLFLWETLRAQERRNCRSSVFKFYLSPRLRFFLMPIPTVCRVSTKKMLNPDGRNFLSEAQFSVISLGAERGNHFWC